MRLLRHKGWRFYGPDGVDKDSFGADAVSGGSLADHDHTAPGDGGILTNDAHDGYAEWTEIATPSNPSANQARLWLEDVNGFSVFQGNDSTGHKTPIGNYFVAKVKEAGGVVKGQVVYVSGGAGANPEVKLAKANSKTTLPAVGFAADTGANNVFIRVDLYGVSVDFDTSAFTDGDAVYVSPTTAGALVTPSPGLPNFVQRVGTVTRSHATQGEVLISLGEINPAIIDGDYGDITVSGNGLITTIDTNVVTNAKLADMAAWTYKIRNNSSPGDPSDAAVADFTSSSPVGADYIVGFKAAGEIRKFAASDFGVTGGGSVVASFSRNFLTMGG